MPAPAKPCTGEFSDETQRQLQQNRDRAQWLSHPCVKCGQQIGGVIKQGKWLPEPHWPSIAYIPKASRKYAPKVPPAQGTSSKTSEL